MPGGIVPERPGPLPLLPTPIVLVLRREPLAAIREVLSLSIHDLVNDAGNKLRVLDFYRAARRIENESWLRRVLEERAEEAWVAAHR